MLDFSPDLFTFEKKRWERKQKVCKKEGKKIIYWFLVHPFDIENPIYTLFVRKQVPYLTFHNKIFSLTTTKLLWHRYPQTPLIPCFLKIFLCWMIRRSTHRRKKRNVNLLKYDNLLIMYCHPSLSILFVCWVEWEQNLPVRLVAHLHQVRVLINSPLIKN